MEIGVKKINLPAAKEKDVRSESSRIATCGLTRGLRDGRGHLQAVFPAVPEVLSPAMLGGGEGWGWGRGQGAAHMQMQL